MTEVINVKQAHRAAMNFTAEAFQAQSENRFDDSARLFNRAFELEKMVAMTFVNELDKEPTRSVVFRSAATLAKDCGYFREAEKLIAQGLAGNPPEGIVEELRDLYEEIKLETVHTTTDAKARGNTFQIGGILKRADADRGKITLQDAKSGKIWVVVVPNGLSELVKTNWGQMIQLLVKKTSAARHGEALVLERVA